MAAADDGLFGALEQRSSTLFLLAGVLLLIAAANRGLAFTIDTYTFNDWIGLAVILGRLAVLFGVLGLSAQLVNHTSRLGKRSRQIAILAILFGSGLLVLGTLENAGFSFAVIAVFGLGTFFLSFLTFALFGIGILRTRAYSQPVGVLLLIAAGLLLVVFFGQLIFTEEIVGTVVEGSLFLVYSALGYLVRADSLQGETSPTANTRSE